MMWVLADHSLPFDASTKNIQWKAINA